MISIAEVKRRAAGGERLFLKWVRFAEPISDGGLFKFADASLWNVPDHSQMVELGERPVSAGYLKVDGMFDSAVVVGDSASLRLCPQLCDYTDVPSVLGLSVGDM